MKAQYTSKTAKARWQKEYEKELAQRTGLPPKELKRVIRSEQIGGGIADIKRQYQAFAGPLKTPEQVARKAKLQSKLTDWYFRHGDAVRHNMPGAGPANLAGTVMMDPDKLQNFVEDLSRRGIKLPKVPKESWPAVARAILQHEQAEGVQLGNVFSGVHPSAAHASHAGLLPLLAERMNIEDPHAVEFMTALRNFNHEDRRTANLLRERGHGVGNYVLPFGGKAHRSAEEWVVKNIKPDAAGLDFQRALSSNLGTPQDFVAHASAIPVGTPAQMRSVRTGGMLNPARLKGLAALGLVAAPIAYGYYRFNKGKQEGLASEKTANWRAVAQNPGAAFTAALVAASPYAAESEAQEAIKHGILPDDPHSRYLTYSIPAVAGLGTYALLSKKYPKASRAVKGLAGLTAASVVDSFATAPLRSEIEGRTEADLVKRYAQAKREGSDFSNYYADPSSFVFKRYNSLLNSVANKEDPPWHTYFLNKDIEEQAAALGKSP